jgi:hypothetical protein
MTEENSREAGMLMPIQLSNEWEAKEKLNKKARQKAPYPQQGENLVKPELVKEWRRYVNSIIRDFCGAAIIKASLAVMQALTEGKSPEEAEKEAKNAIYCEPHLEGITGVIAAAVAGTVVHFHHRGEEFRNYWNRQYLPEANAATGAVILIYKPGKKY